MSSILPASFAESKSELAIGGDPDHLFCLPLHLSDMFTLGSPCLRRGPIVPFNRLPTGSCLLVRIAQPHRLCLYMHVRVSVSVCVDLIVVLNECVYVSALTGMFGLVSSLQIMDKSLLPSVTLIVGCGVSSLTLLLLIIIYVSVWK